MQHLLEALELGERGVFITNSPDPDGVRRCLLSFHQQQPDAFRRLNEAPSGLAFLTAVFANSRFLSEEIIRHPDWIEPLVSSPEMFRPLSAEEYSSRIEASLDDGSIPSALDLAVFRRRELLRILLRDVLGYAPLSEVAE